MPPWRVFIAKCASRVRSRTATSVAFTTLARSDGQHFLSMEFISGEELASLMRRIGRLPPDKANEIARQLCAGLAAAHDTGILHRDLKPANIMIDNQGNVRITDFGIAGLVEEIRTEDVTAGTPSYMSPEQIEGRELTIRSDLYSLGWFFTSCSPARRHLKRAPWSS